MIHRPLWLRVLAYAICIIVSIFFLYPYWWMLLGAFRPAEAVLTEPLRLWPETFDFSVPFEEIARVGGVSIWRYLINSFWITGASTVLSVADHRARRLCADPPARPLGLQGAALGVPD